MADVDIGCSGKSSVRASELAFNHILIRPECFNLDATFRVADDGPVRLLDCRGSLAKPEGGYTKPVPPGCQAEYLNANPNRRIGTVLPCQFVMAYRNADMADAHSDGTECGE
jgi:hypothetical protein